MHEPHILPIAKRGEPILQQRAHAVSNVHDPAIQQLIDNMLATMLVANGVGIAAPQVFSPLRIIIVASRPNQRYPDAPLMEPLALINPEILWRSAKTSLYDEGCLSVPDTRVPMERAEQLQVRYLTRDGQAVETRYHGFIARIIQHEYDHIEGILIQP